MIWKRIRCLWQRKTNPRRWATPRVSLRVEALECLCLPSPVAGGSAPNTGTDLQHGPALFGPQAPGAPQTAPMQVKQAATNPVYKVYSIRDTKDISGYPFLMDATVLTPDGPIHKTVPRGCCVP